MRQFLAVLVILLVWSGLSQGAARPAVDSAPHSSAPVPLAVLTADPSAPESERTRRACAAEDAGGAAARASAAPQGAAGLLRPAAQAPGRHGRIRYRPQPRAPPQPA